MVGTLNSTSTIELELNPQNISHTARIVAICHFEDELLNYNLVLGRDLLYESGETLNKK